MDPHRSVSRTGTPDDTEGLWEWSLESDRILFSPRWLALIGCEDDDVGSTPDDWFKRVHPDDRDQLLRDIQVARAGDAPTFGCRYRLRHKDDTYRWMSCRGNVVRDSAGRAIRLSGSQSDVTVEMVTDPLTRLPNRLMLIDRMAQSIERAHRYEAFHFAVLLIDLGQLASPDQPSGTTINDAMLTAVARRLETCLRIPQTMASMRHNDLAARIDGDQFAILLDGLKAIAHAKVVADRILGELLNPFTIRGREIRVSASIGIAVSASGYTTAEEMLNDAETALHRAHMLGGRHCEFFDTAILTTEQSQLRLEGDLEAALERREFEVFYQPIVSLASNEILGFEALVRWRHPVLGMIAPADFIPIAERTGSIVPLGNWILREACFRLSQWQTGLPASRDLSVSVNVSSVQWSDPALLDQIGEALRDSGLESRRLVLELTEGIAMVNPAAIITLLMRLRAMGVRISIDDFGTGFSSLAYLRQFPIDTLKIDRSFVRGLITKKDTAEIVVGLMIMSQQLGLHVVAEGIEQEDQCAQLRALKCDAGQGYLFAKPLDVDAVAEILKTGLPPRAESRRDAPQPRRRETRTPQRWTRGRLFVTRNRAAVAGALVLMLSAGLAIVLGSVRTATVPSLNSETAVNQQPSRGTLPPPAFPQLTIERVVEPPMSPSVAPVTTEKEASPGRSSSLAPAAPPTNGKEASPGRGLAPRPAASPTPSSAAIEASSLATAPALATHTTSLNVIHLHRFGNCRGQLDMTRDGVAFLSEEDNHEAFTLKYAEFLHTLSGDTLTLKSATRTYRFRTGVASTEGVVPLRDVADRIARSRR